GCRISYSRAASANDRSVHRWPARPDRRRGIIVIPSRRTSPYGNDLAATGRLGRTRAALRGRGGHFAQWPVGRSAARVSGREETRTSHGTPTTSASASAGDRAASQGRPSPAPSVSPGWSLPHTAIDSAFYMRQRNTFHSGFYMRQRNTFHSGFYVSQQGNTCVVQGPNVTGWRPSNKTALMIGMRATESRANSRNAQ